jgi:hypothetical protein
VNYLEQLAVGLILTILQTVIKDPTKKAELQSQLIAIATDIAGVYGYTLQPPASVVAARPIFPK